MGDDLFYRSILYMAEALKNIFNKKLLKNLSYNLGSIDRNINANTLYKSFPHRKWQTLELKQRITAISRGMHEQLTGSYNQKMKTLIECSRLMPGFQSLIFPEYIQLYGLNLKNEKYSLKALKELTKFSTSEFAIRNFIKRNPEKLMQQLSLWAKESNHHVRRLSSEGCRPRLPWGEHLKIFIEDPQLIWPILETLKRDPEEYVRKSVANNLNDISKDHPDMVLSFAKNNWGVHENTNRLLKHGLRTLLKKSEPKALKIIGYNQKAIRSVGIQTQKSVHLGDKLNFKIQYQLTTDSTVRIEFKMFFLKANKTYTTKVFKLSEKMQKNGTHMLEAHYSFRPITTRKYHAGEHFIAAIINGKESEKIKFKLIF